MIGAVDLALWLAIDLAENAEAQRLSRRVGKGCAIAPLKGTRQGLIGGLQMALQAHLQFPLRAQAGGVHDGGAHLLWSGSRLAEGGDMLLSRTMASLAIDPLG